MKTLHHSEYDDRQSLYRSMATLLYQYMEYRIQLDDILLRKFGIQPTTVEDNAE